MQHFLLTDSFVEQSLQVNMRDREVTADHRIRFNRLIGSAPRTFQQQAQAVIDQSLSLAGMHR